MNTNETLNRKLDLIAATLADNGEQADATDTFSRENYQLLQEHKFFSAMVPRELGGGGLGYGDMAALLTRMAKSHPSTALSLSMHQHIVAANTYKHLHGQPAKALLEKVSAQELILVSTGAGDWLSSSGEMEKVAGGYQLSGAKHFASGSPAGNVLVTSAPYEDPEDGWQVLHFPVSLGAEGVSVMDNWAPMGMRGSGSNSVKLEQVFIAEESIAARRPRGDFHAMYCVILPVALPLIMSVYCGIAEAAAEQARQRCSNSIDPVTPYILGEMENAVTTAQVMVDDMIALVGEFNFEASVDLVNEIVKRKTIAAQACKTAAAKAVEVCGGGGFMRAAGVERLLRDVMASHFHPMQEKRQLLFTGTLAMGKQPPPQAW